LIFLFNHLVLKALAFLDFRSNKYLSYTKLINLLFSVFLQILVN